MVRQVCSFWATNESCTPSFHNNADTLFCSWKYRQTLILLHFSKNNRKQLSVKCVLFFLIWLVGHIPGSTLHLWFSPSSFLINTLMFYIHNGWWNCKFSTMAGSFYKKLWHKRESGTASSAEVAQSDMLECGQTYKITLLLRKISFHNLCNLPVLWEESPAPTLSIKFPGDLSFLLKNQVQNGRMIQTTNYLSKFLKALKSLPLGFATSTSTCLTASLLPLLQRSLV